MDAIENKIRVLLPILLLTSNLWSQIDTTVVLDSIRVSEPLTQSVDVTHHPIYSYDGLEDHPSTFIRNYGPSNSAFLTLFGSSAQQNVITWEGIPIQNAMLGTTDLSLIPLQSFDQVQIISSGSASQGSSAIGGTLNLASDDYTDTPFRLTTGLASFGTGMADWKLQQSSKDQRWQLSMSLSSLWSQNDYEIEKRGESIPQQNGKFARHNLQVNASFRPRANQSMTLRTWQTAASRQIPALSSQLSSEASQTDRVSRSMLEWNIHQSRMMHEIQVGHFNDFIHYIDPVISLSAESETTQSFINWNGLCQWKQWTFGSKYRLNRLSGSIDNYDSTEIEWRGLVSGKAQFETGNFLLDFNLGVAHRDYTFSPVNPQLFVQYKLPKGFNLSAQIKHDFRFPTLNDLFWNPGGNLDLSPEKGWSQFVNLEHATMNSRSHWKTKITAFHRLINDWIQWAPGELLFWEARNLTTVRSYGISTWSQLGWTFSNHEFGVNLGYDLSRTVHEKDIANPRFEKGSQLFYIPVHQVTSEIQYAFDDHSWELKYQFTSEQNGVNENVEQFALWDATYSTKWVCESLAGKIHLGCKNLGDRRYAVIERRPMPGRNYFITLEITLP